MILPIGSREFVSATAMCFLFGLDEGNHVADERKAVWTFVAYLRKIIDDELLANYIPRQLEEESLSADGYTFGKPVWDFEYPESSFFITEDGYIGCRISSIVPGDIVAFVPGCTYPLVLRPDGDHFLVKGYAYVHKVMMAELRYLKLRELNIR